MNEKKKREAINAGVTARGIMLVEECEKFIKENEDLLSVEIEDMEHMESEELKKKVDRAEKVMKKVEWYDREIKIEREKSAKPFKLIEEYLMKDKNIAM